MTPTPTPPVPFLKRITIRNFKSIAYCDVELGPLTILVGRNGSGKSNFLDAIRFVGDSMRVTLSHAIESRAGWKNVIHQPGNPTNRLSMQLTLALSPGLDAEYEFEIADDPDSITEYSVEGERLRFHRLEGESPRGFDRDENANDALPLAGFFKYHRDLFLNLIFRLQAEYIPTYNDLKSLRVLNMSHLDFKEMRRPQNRSKDHLVDESGKTLAEVAYRVQTEHPWLWERITGYLGAITPIVRQVKAESLGDDNYVHLKFIESIAEQSDDPSIPNVDRTFTAASMSDGTLRALAALLAINPIPNHPLANAPNPVRLVGVEEPESGLHPAAAGVLMSALREAAESRQIVVTTQSDDLLDRYDPETDRLLVAEMRDGATEIASIDRSREPEHHQEAALFGWRTAAHGSVTARLGGFATTEARSGDRVGGCRAMSRLRVAPIVEGHGESDGAIRVLIERLWPFLGGEFVEILRPWRRSRGELIRRDDLKRAVEASLEKLAAIG